MMNSLLKNIVGNKKLAYICLVLSYLVSLLYSYFLSFTERGLPLLDSFNVGLHLFWLVILVWIAWDINKNKRYVKGTLLFLAILLVLLTGLDYFEADRSIQLVSLSLIEALLLFITYFTIQKPIEVSVLSEEAQKSSVESNKNQIMLPFLSSLGLGIISAGLTLLLVTIIFGSTEFSLCIAIISMFLLGVFYFLFLRKKSKTINIVFGSLCWAIILLVMWFGTYDDYEDYSSNSSHQNLVS